MTQPSEQPTHEILGLSPEAWDVLGTALTALAFLVAAVAAWVAYRQLKANQETRLDQTRPYVLVTADSDPDHMHLLDVIVQNVGSGPARNVSIKIDPPLLRAREDSQFSLADSRIFSAPIPMLPPGFKLRTFFDSAIERNDVDMPKTHDVTVTYEDGHGHRWKESSVLDLSLHEGLLYTETYTMHHVGKALRDILALLKKSSTLTQAPLHVAVENRDDYVARRDAAREKQREAREALEQRLRAAQSPEGSADQSSADGSSAD